MSNDDPNSLEEGWQKSRSGAWAGRGFHYQHGVCTVLAVRLLTGTLPPGRLVPEGLEDCVIEFAASATYLQIKSKANGPVAASFARDVMEKARRKASNLSTDHVVRVCTVFEHEIAKTHTAELNALDVAADDMAFMCLNPIDEVIDVLCAFYDCPPAVARLIGDSLYARISEIAGENAKVDYANRLSLSAPDIANIATGVLRSSRGSRLEEAMMAGHICPVAFEADDQARESFYLGVKARPKHIAAGLVFERPIDLSRIEEQFLVRKPVMITGPSGSGKSALLWSFVDKTATRFRWFEVTQTTTLQDLSSITLALKALLPSERSPIAFAIDEVTNISAELWRSLCRLQSDFAYLYLIGTIRNEDRVILDAAPETTLVTPQLDDGLAKSIWQRLREGNRTDWVSWQEPFGMSDGLMLEYVHILTRGSRLSSVIAEQIQTRRTEKRFDELRILRLAATFGAYEAQLDTTRLLAQLDIDPEEGSVALARLLDEHLVREIEPGVFGGLHALRSEAISQILVDDLTHKRTDVLTKGLFVVTPASLPTTLLRLDQSGLMSEETLLSTIVTRLRQDAVSPVWTGALAGLGRMSLNRYAAQIRTIIDKANLSEAQASLATMMMLIENDQMDTLMGLPQLAPVMSVVQDIQALDVEDLRSDCFNRLDRPIAPVSETLEEGTFLLRSLIPLPNGQPLDVNMRPDFELGDDLPIKPIIELLTAAHAVDRQIAIGIVEALGGEMELLNALHRQTPFITQPELDIDENGERAVRSNYVLICAEAQPSDIHGEVVRLCDILYALTPSAKTIMCDAITPDGAIIEIGGIATASKRIPRKNMVLSDQVSWNVALRSIVFEGEAVQNRTEQLNLMRELCQRTEKVFRAVSEKWIKGHRRPMSPHETKEAEAILTDAKALKIEHAAPDNPLKPQAYPNETPRFAVNASVFSEIFGQGLNALVVIQNSDDLPRHALALFDIEKALNACAQSPDWHNLGIPCPKSLNDLILRVQALSEIAMILSEGDMTMDTLRSVAKSARPGRRVMTSLDRARRASERRLKSMLDDLASQGRDMGIDVKYWLGQQDQSLRVLWPRQRTLIGYDIAALESAPEALLSMKGAISEAFADKADPTVVPTSHGQPILSGATRAAMGLDLPVDRDDFLDVWSETLSLGEVRRPFFEAFQRGLGALIQLSGLVALRRQHELRSEEADLWNLWLDEANAARKSLRDLIPTHDGIVEEAADILDRLNDVVADESERMFNGQAVEGVPLCGQALPLLSGDTEGPLALAGVAAVLLEAEDIRVAIS